MRINLLYILLITLVAVWGCGSREDDPGPHDPRLDRPYCNDPQAVNYNWNFPGKPDSTVCFFPAHVLEGSYRMDDSVYLEDNSLDTASITTRYFRLIALSKEQLAMTGFCGGPQDTLFFTTDRFYRAPADTTFAEGQFFCSVADTLTGYLQRPAYDTFAVYIDFSVTGPGGLRFHRGTAVKQ